MNRLVLAAASLAALASLGALASPVAAEPYRWPVNPGPPVTAYFDHGQLRDWRCQNNTYNGHKGTDIGVARNTQVFAADDGRVNHRTDGYGDGFLGSTDGGGFGNAIALFHGGGHESIYGHFTAGSGLPAMGANVSCSAPIGRSGASGNVTGPHVHFETRINVNEASYYSGSADDPYAGPCGGPLSYWTNQNSGAPTAACSAPPAPVDGSTFVSDVTVPDGTRVTAGQAFVKTWRLRNTGSSTWGNGYQLVHVDGPAFGAGAVGVAAGPGAEVNVSLDMVASGTGVQRSRWQMAHDGNRFGTIVWVEVDVVAAPAPDADGDGVTADLDCDDADASVPPGADAACDGRDLSRGQGATHPQHHPGILRLTCWNRKGYEFAPPGPRFGTRCDIALPSVSETSHDEVPDRCSDRGGGGRGFRGCRAGVPHEPGPRPGERRSWQRRGRGRAAAWPCPAGATPTKPRRCRTEWP